MRKNLTWLIAVAFLCTGPAAWSDDKIFVQLPATLDSGAVIDEDVKQQCNIEALVGDQVFKKVKERHPATVALSTEPGSERFIRLRVVTAKRIQVDTPINRIGVIAEIVQDKKVVASRTFGDMTLTNPGPGFRLCEIMEYIAAGVGKKVARWAPSAYMRALPQ